MRLTGTTSIIAASALALAPIAAKAQSARHAPVDRAPGWEIRAQTERAQNEPGLTSELSPGAKQTATGGPSGGVPGFSGH